MLMHQPPHALLIDDQSLPTQSSTHVCWHGQCHYTDADLNGGSSRTAAGSCDERKPTTARDEILRVLEDHAPDALSPLEVAEELADMSINTIRVSLQRMAKDGEIEQPTRGKYGVTSLN